MVGIALPRALSLRMAVARHYNEWSEWMATVDPGSTVPRRQLGRYLRQLREGAGITVRSAADALEWSTPRLWRIEKGAVAMRALDVRNMCQVYGAPDNITEALMGLARETKSRGWWQSYGDAVPDWFELFVGLEAAACRLRQYETELVPGLLQTKGYASELFVVHHVGIDDQTLDKQVAVRMERQGLLSRRLPDPPQLEVVLNEAVLRRPTRNRSAMAAQLEHLLDVAENGNITIRVLPLAAGIHRAMIAGAFVILDFPANGGREGEPPTVYSESVTGALYLDKPGEVAAYVEIWDSIIDASLNEDGSRQLVAAVAREY
jgi:transcriptional regulator with XRE-family HTH domain